MGNEYPICTTVIKMPGIGNLPYYSNEEFDFNKLIPMPAILGDVCADNEFLNEILSWRIANWDVIDNASGTIRSEDEISFATQLKPPLKVLRRLSELHPNETITCICQGMGGSITGQLILFAGDIKDYTHCGRKLIDNYKIVGNA